MNGSKVANFAFVFLLSKLRILFNLCFVLAFAMFCLVCFSTFAANSVTVPVNIKVLKLLSISQTAGLDFGTIVKPGTVGKISVSTTGSVSITNGLERLSSVSIAPADINISGTVSNAVLVSVGTLASTITGVTFDGVVVTIGDGITQVACGSQTLPTTLTSASCSATNMIASGLVLKVGGTLNVATNVAIGNYNSGQISYKITAV